MIGLACAAILAVGDGAGLSDALQAMQSGRLEQAQIILNAAASSGAEGEQLSRLQAELAYRSGDWSDALARYERLAAVHPDETLTLERAGIAAFHVRDLGRAASALRGATTLPGASWRAWNALGAVADLRRDWAEADRSYDQAIELAPRRPELLNNRGWSLMLRGEWADALRILEQAEAMDSGSKRIAANVELARAAIAKDLPQRRSGENDADWAARLNDAGVVAAAGGDRLRAIAAFAQAIEARAQWFERAANNLTLIE